MTVTDDDAEGVTVAKSTDPISFSENGGSGTFTVRLNTEPLGTVVIDVASSNTSKAMVNKNQLAFTDANWSAPQQVTVAGVDDLIADGSHEVTIIVDVNQAQTTDTGYAALTPAEVEDVQVTVTDDDGLP